MHYYCIMQNSFTVQKILCSTFSPQILYAIILLSLGKTYFPTFIVISSFLYRLYRSLYRLYRSLNFQPLGGFFLVSSLVSSILECGQRTYFMSFQSFKFCESCMFIFHKCSMCVWKESILLSYWGEYYLYLYQVTFSNCIIVIFQNFIDFSDLLF